MHSHLLISQPSLISVYCQLSAAFASNKTIRKDISGRADIHDIKHSPNNNFVFPLIFVSVPENIFHCIYKELLLTRSISEKYKKVGGTKLSEKYSPKSKRYGLHHH